MAGGQLVEAGEDAIQQLQHLAGGVLACEAREVHQISEHHRGLGVGLGDDAIALLELVHDGLGEDVQQQLLRAGLVGQHFVQAHGQEFFLGVLVLNWVESVLVSSHPPAPSHNSGGILDRPFPKAKGYSGKLIRSLRSRLGRARRSTGSSVQAAHAVSGSSGVFSKNRGR
jgi:hypothetical protein